MQADIDRPGRGRSHLCRQPGTSTASSSSPPTKRWGRASPSRSNTTRTTSTAPLTILDVMRRHNCHNIIFSSSATVYGDPASVPHPRGFPHRGDHQPLRHHQGVHRAHPDRLLQGRPGTQRRAAALLQPHRRAPVRPHWRRPQRHPQQPRALHRQGLRSASWRRSTSTATTTRRPTVPGVRDYIHVVDLARGHVAAIRKLAKKARPVHLQPRHRPRLQRAGCHPCVQQGLRPRPALCHRPAPPRRYRPNAGCDTAKAKQELGWQAEYGIEDMCRDSWNWQSRNPDGYKTAQAQVTPL